MNELTLTDEPVTLWIHAARQGDGDALRELWNRYGGSVARHAQQRLRGLPISIADEEDIAVSVFHSFWDAATAGRLAGLSDRRELWRLLVRMATRKVVDLIRRETRQKRDAGQLCGDLPNCAAAEDKRRAALAHASSPEFAVLMAEQTQSLIDRLHDETLEAIALWKLEGYTNQEIADRQGCSVSTVERCLRIIRMRWKRLV